MRISEFEYHLISELITMPDRELAQRVELDLFRRGSSPDNQRLTKYLAALKNSGSPKQFQVACTELILSSGLEFLSENGLQATPHAKLNVANEPEECYAERLIDGELYEAI